MLIVMTTVPSLHESDAMAVKIIESKLAACVQILPPMTSVYVWEGKVNKESEHLLLIKTLEEKYDELASFITANHSYDIPEIVAIKAEKVSEPYLNWMSSAFEDQRSA
ncbi:MAG: divalent-cation tolerance protein CutA [Pyrinomonadaceae bacterium]|nr:divalent-cation tolerance protein CutA [Acidobacteriota bacterium]MBP7377904.1 divalent-cation tolerance protein CutA [Pyrinomonadaceae bacterium]MBP7476815.1 divalent-cation tolerance protein CutA [Pyrinomonadaceae bacterium]